MKNLNTITRCASLYRDEHLADYGLTGYQAPYLPEICANPGITQDQLAGKIHVNRSSVTRQLALLEGNGFITRKQRENDHRAIEVYPTQKMQDILPHVMEIMACWRSELTQQLTAEEIDFLETIIDRLATRAEEIK